MVRIYTLLMEPAMQESVDKKVLGKTGEYVSSIGLGTWGIRNYSRAEDVLVKAVEYGINLVDTAEMYGSGLAEEMVGRVLKKVGKSHLFITTKVMPHNARSRDRLLKVVKASLRRLGVSEVDLLLIHWPDDAVPVELQIRNLEAAYEAGLTRYIGVSNFNLSLLTKAINSTKVAEIVVDQVHYSVLYRAVEKDLLPFATRESIGIQAYTPLERGLVAHNEVLRKIAEEIGKTPIQVALNYLISNPVVFAIPKTESLTHLQEIVGAMGWKLSKEHIEKIRREIPVT